MRNPALPPESLGQIGFGAEGETENMGVCTKERRGGTAEVLMAPLPALIHWEVKLGGTSMKDVGGAGFAGSSPPFLGRERAAVDVDVGPERRSARYHPPADDER